MVGEIKRLRRDPGRGSIGGVAAGLADYFGVDPVLVRVGFVAATLVNGLGLLLYLVCWVVMPPREGGERARPRSVDGYRNRVAIGAVLIGIGLVVLAFRVPWLYWPAIEIVEGYWPLLVILAGLAFVVGGLKGATDG